MLRRLIAVFAVALFAAVAPQAVAQQSQLLPGQLCFQATTGIAAMVGALGTITAGSGGISGTYITPLTGGNGTGATASVTVSGGGVTAVNILNPGTGYQVNNTLSALAANIGGTTGFTVVINSISINSSLAGGTVGYYIPGTLNVKQTYQNATGSIMNTNPVQLDQNGCALVWGAGNYRQILYDSLGDEISDTLTNVPLASPFWAGSATGSANAITLTDSGFSETDGSAISFLAANTNTGSTTITVNGFTINVEKNSSSGPVLLTGGEIISGNAYTVVYSATGNDFILSNPSAAATVATCGLSATVATNKLTVALVTQANATPTGSAPCTVTFGGQTGPSTTITVSAATTLVTAASGSTFGSVSTAPFNVWVVALDVAGTVVLGISDQSNSNLIFPLNQAIAISTAGCGNPCSSASALGTIYSTNAQSSVQMSVIGYASFDSGQSTAGVWASSPTRVTPYEPGTPLPGTVIQDLNVQTSVSASTANNYTLSNTPPTPGAGAIAVSQGISGSSPENILRISANSNHTNSGSTANVFNYIYNGSSTLATAGGYLGSNGGIITIPILLQQMISPSAVYTLYYTSLAGTTYINTVGGSLQNPGLTSYMRIQEIQGALDPPVNDNEPIRKAA